jgi:hypothetical protein
LGLGLENPHRIDLRVIDSLRNCTTERKSPGALADAKSPGFDLAAANIQRGRDHGIQDYNSVRAALGLEPVREFSQITRVREVSEKLERLYVSIERVDPWVGVLAEDALPGAHVGETLAAGIAIQFDRLRRGDRFWYEWDPFFDEADRQVIENTTLSDIVSRNAGLSNLSRALLVR